MAGARPQAATARRYPAGATAGRLPRRGAVTSRTRSAGPAELGMVVARHLLFEADVVTRHRPLPGGPPEVDKVAVRPGLGCRVGCAGSPARRGIAPITRLSGGAIE